MVTTTAIPGLPRVFDTLEDAARELPKESRAVGSMAATRFAAARKELVQLASVLDHDLAVVPHNRGAQLTVFVVPRPAPEATPNAPAPAGEDPTA